MASWSRMLRSIVPVLLFAGVGLAIATVGILVWIGEGIGHIAFAKPLWLVAIGIPIVSVVVHQAWNPRPATMQFSRVPSIRRLKGGLGAYFAALPDGFRLAAAVLLAVALARPQSTRGSDRIQHEGIDIVIAFDLSLSMQADDLLPNRLIAAKQVIDSFIRRRPRDRVGLVAFGTTASTVAPLTMDHSILRSLVQRLELGMVDGNGTAIGAGLGVALNRLKESDAKTQVIVLLTDGVHNAPGLDPDSAAQAAADRGVSIYTVLMGDHSQGGDTSIDPGQLERIAGVTGGYAYVATDHDALVGSFQDLLDKLERSTIVGEQVRPELFWVFLWPALMLLLVDIGLRTTRLRRFP